MLLARAVAGRPVRVQWMREGKFAQRFAAIQSAM